MNFTDYFKVSPAKLQSYGAFDISLESDLPLFIDPFLIFNSSKPEYQELHEAILKYLTFLRDKALAGNIDDGLLLAWFCFKEVKQNWLGFTLLGNDGHGLGMDFARSLNSNLGRLFSDPAVPISESKHLEKVALIRGGVGRDSLSDFTTNLIKEYLLNYTQTFARKHLPDTLRKRYRIRRVSFNYETASWQDAEFELPALNPATFVILTPSDMLTRDSTWINRGDLIQGFWNIPEAIDDDALRAQVSHYFEDQLRRRPNPKRAPNKREREEAVDATIQRYPEVLDYYIALKEMDGERATDVSAELVQETKRIFNDQVRQLVTELLQEDGFYRGPVTSFEEALSKAKAFKHYVEDKDGYKLINKGEEPFAAETDVQLFFGLAFVNTTFDVNREPNNGRGPVDYAVSKGRYNKSLIEFKLGSNTQLKRNLQKQVKIYEEANETKKSVKVIVNYTAAHEKRVNKILKELGLSGSDFVVVIDARADNKPSASRA